MSERLIDKAESPKNTVIIDEDRYTDLQNAAHLFGVVKAALIEHGCPWPEVCHVPTVVGNFLDEVCKGRKGGQ